MCSLCKNNARQTLQRLSSELKLVLNELRIIECTISEVISKSDDSLRSQYIVSLQKFDQINQTIEALSKFTMNVSTTDLSRSEFQKEIKKIHLEAIRNRMGPDFGVDKTHRNDVGEDNVELF